MNPRRPSMVLTACFLGWIAVAICAGCGGGDRPMRPPGSRPPAFQLEAFPDIPLPLGFVPDPLADQLAVSLGGGGLRRYDVTVVHHSDGGPEPIVVMDDLRRGLEASGWAGDSFSERTVRSFTKGGEALTVEAGRSAGVTTVRLRLRPPEP